MEIIVHYYQFNIGDYSSHTSRLSIYEDIAYRRLLDLYYLSERPLNGCSTDVAREIGMSDSLGDVEYVLNKFFIEKNNAWYNKRCDNEIKVYHNKQKSAKKAGVASGVARKKKRTDVEQPLNEKRTNVEPNINHKPITNNHKDQNNTSSPKVNDQVPFQDIVNKYHEILPELPKCEILNAKRKGYIRQRWQDKEHGLHTITHWENFFKHVKKSDFLITNSLECLKFSLATQLISSVKAPLSTISRVIISK